MGPKFFQFHAVFWFGEYLAKSYVGAPGGLSPPPRGNPGFTTGHFRDLDPVDLETSLIFDTCPPCEKHPFVL